MYTLSTTNQFEKDWKRCVKRGYDMTKIKEAISLLVSNGSFAADIQAA